MNPEYSYMKMEEYKAALLAFKQVIELYYDTEFIELAHLKTIACYIKKMTSKQRQITMQTIVPRLKIL